MEPTPKNRRVGIPGIDKLPWGEHLCVFFNTKDELLGLTVPFMQAGLEDNEFCMWITSDPVNEKDAFEALQAVLPNAHQYLAHRQLEIVPANQWYLVSGVFDAQIVLNNWVSKVQQAESKGFAGIRITGNPLWLQSEEDWALFGSYEQAVHKGIRTEPVIALCTYPMKICESKNMLGMLSAHGSMLLPFRDKWQRIVLSSEGHGQPST